MIPDELEPNSKNLASNVHYTHQLSCPYTYDKGFENFNHIWMINKMEFIDYWHSWYTVRSIDEGAILQ